MVFCAALELRRVSGASQAEARFLRTAFELVQETHLPRVLCRDVMGLYAGRGGVQMRRPLNFWVIDAKLVKR